MKNKLHFLLLFTILLISSQTIFGQVEEKKEEKVEEIEDASRSQKLADTKKATSKGISLKNTDTDWRWLAAQWYTLGGNSVNKYDWVESYEDSRAFNAQAQLFLVYQNKNLKFRWENQLETGISYSQKGEEPGKYSSDKIFYLTKANYRISKKSKFFYSALFALNSTFLDNVDAKGNITKGWMTPGTIEFGPGINYKNKPGSVSIFGSPFTKKTVYVIGSGNEYNTIKKKEKIFSNETEYRQFGFLVNSIILFDITKSISYQGNYDLFSDYLHDPENVFVNMHNTFRFALGKNLALSWGLNFIYDEHLYSGPQFKSELGLTFSPKIQTKVPTKRKK